MKKHCCLTICLGLIIAGAGDAGQNVAAPKTNESRPDVAASLKWFNGLIGSWRGVGQEKRGSGKGAWSEKLTCEWNFDDQPAVVFRAQKGKQFETLRFQWDATAKQLEMTQHTAVGVRRYQ